MLFFASTYLFVGLFPDQPLAAKFTAAFGAINFMCLLGSFSLLGYISSPFDVSAVDFERCERFFDLLQPDSDVTRCTSFYNTVAICYLMLAMCTTASKPHVQRVAWPAFALPNVCAAYDTPER